MVKILLARGCPRGDIEFVEIENPKLPCDKLLVMYTNEYKAYAFMRNYFLEHSYDYLVLATDDIVVLPEHIIQLKKDLEESHYKILGGMMNVDQHEWRTSDGNLNICYQLGVTDRVSRFYDWIKRDALPKEDIFRVAFNGFGLLAIKRSIIEGYEFATDGIWRGPNPGPEKGASVDYVFCRHMADKGIPIFVDKRIDMRHYRLLGRNKVGLKPEDWWLMKEGSDELTKDNSGSLYELRKAYKSWVSNGKGSESCTNTLLDSISKLLLTKFDEEESNATV